MSEAASSPGRSDGRAIAFAIAAASLLALAALAVWLADRISEDLYMGLSAGRDVAAGRLGALDDWSFTAADRVWINQNWLAHLFFYKLHEAGGWPALAAGKAILVAALAALLAWIALLARTPAPAAPKEVSPLAAGAWIVAAGALIASAGYIDLRPNLLGLVLLAALCGSLSLAERARPGETGAAEPAASPPQPQAGREFPEVERPPAAALVAVLIVALWSHVHGSFLLGLALLALWAALRLRPWMRRGRASLRPGRARLGPGRARPGPAILLALVPLGAAVLAVVTSPFVLENLTHPLVVARSAAWKDVAEWRPLFGWSVWNVGGAHAYTLAAGVVLLLSLGAGWTAGASRVWPAWTGLGALFFVWHVARALPSLRRMPGSSSQMLGYHAALLAGFGLVAAAALVLWLRHRRQGRLAPIPTGQAFALVASLLGIWLALSSRRFVPVSLILLAPVAAAVLQEVGRSLTSNRLRWSCGAAVLLLLLPIASSLRSSARYYSPEQPFNQGEPFAARMFRLSTYPEGLAAFVRANGIDGRVLNEWGWEGYLRWHCPQLRFYLGARAQQIYREETYLEWQHAMQGSSTRAASSTPPGPVSDGPASQPGQARDLAALLRAHAIGLAVIDLRSPYLSRFAIITSSPGSAWAPVYTDGKAALLVDTATPAGAGLVEMVRSGRAVFADPAVGLYSRAMCNAATVVNGDPRLTLESLVGANRIRPIPAAYQAIGALHGTAAAERSWFRGYLGQEVERLSGAAVDSRPRLDWLLSAREAARALARVCRAEGALEDARTAEERAEETGRTLESLTRRWS